MGQTQRHLFNLFGRIQFVLEACRLGHLAPDGRGAYRITTEGQRFIKEQLEQFHAQRREAACSREQSAPGRS